MKIITKIQYGTSLPYSIKIDNLQGMGNCPASAVMAALSAGRKIPTGMRDRKKAVAYILDNYPINKEWMKLIHILEDDKFDKNTDTVCEKCVFGRIKKRKSLMSAGAEQCSNCSENYNLLFVPIKEIYARINR